MTFFLSKYTYNTNCLIVKSLENIPYLAMLIKYISYIEETNQLFLLENLIKKAFSKLYKNFKNGIYNINVSNINECNVALFILSFLNADANKIDQDLLEVLLEASQIIYEEVNVPCCKDSDIMSDLRFKEIIKKYNLNKNTSTNKILKIILDDYNKDFSLFLASKGFNIKQIEKIVLSSFDGEFDLKDKFISTGKQSMKNLNSFQFINRMLECFTINSTTIRDEELTLVDVKAILEYLKLSLYKKAIDIEEVEESFIVFTIVYSVFKVLNKNTSTVASLFIEKNNEEVLFNRERSELQNEIFSLKKEQEEKTIALKNKELEIERLNKELEKTRAQVNALNNKLSKVDDNKEELNNLRELFFSLENKSENVDLRGNNAFEVDSLSKIAFIGGSDSLRNKLKEEFPSFVYISPDDVTKDLSFIRNMDYIFIHTHMSHSLYFKIIDIIRFNKISFSFLNEINIDLLKSNILNKLKNTFKED